MKKLFLLFAMLSFAAVTAVGQTVFEYDKKGNQIRRSRVAKISSEIKISEDTTIEKGTVVRLSATGGETYTWSTGATSAEIEVSPDISTCYFVTVRDVCLLEKTDSVEVKVMNISPNADPQQALRFEVMPNPAKDFVNVVFDLPRAGVSQLRLINSAGEVLRFKEFSTQNLNQIFSLENYPAGQYFLNLGFEGAVFTKKITVLP